MSERSIDRKSERDNSFEGEQEFLLWERHHSVLMSLSKYSLKRRSLIADLYHLLSEVKEGRGRKGRKGVQETTTLRKTERGFQMQELFSTGPPEIEPLVLHEPPVLFFNPCHKDLFFSQSFSFHLQFQGRSTLYRISIRTANSIVRQEGQRWFYWGLQGWGKPLRW